MYTYRHCRECAFYQIIHCFAKTKWDDRIGNDFVSLSETAHLE